MERVEQLTEELARAHETIDKLKCKIIDPFERLKDPRTNSYMFDVPRAKRPPNIIVTTDSVLKVQDKQYQDSCLLKLDKKKIFEEFFDEMVEADDFDVTR